MIAAQLNAKGIPSPRGGLWNGSTICGNVKRDAGIINNRLYIGKLVYERQKMVKNPATGRRETRSVPKSEWVEVDVPELAIVPVELFEAAQKRRLEMARGPNPNYKRNAHLLSGLVKCAHCGSTMAIVKKDRVACSGRRRGICTMTGTIRIAEVIERVIRELKAFLLTPEQVEIAVKTMQEEFAALHKSVNQERHRLERERANNDRAIKNLLRAMEAAPDSKALVQRLTELEREREAIEAQLKIAEKETHYLMHPNAPAAYRKTVESLHAALKEEDPNHREELRLLRELIDTVLIGQGDPNTPEKVGERRSPMFILVKGNLEVLSDKQLSATTGTSAAVTGSCSLHPLPPISKSAPRAVDSKSNVCRKGFDDEPYAQRRCVAESPESGCISRPSRRSRGHSPQVLIGNAAPVESAQPHAFSVPHSQ